MLTYPNINPVALQIGPVAIRWYSLAYIAGIVGGWFYIKKLNALTKVLSAKAYDEILTWGILGIILGGRLGYVMFYNPMHFLREPAEIFMLWQGGMSFHGGLLGTIISMLVFCQKYKIKYLQLMDMCAVVAPMGLFFGRIANFINGELYGNVTTSPLGMVFPTGGALPRHPSQLYEATLEGLVTFAIINIAFWKFGKWKYKGYLSGLFLLLYGIFRAFIELFRQPDAQIGYIEGLVTMGQILCIPMVVAGIYLICKSLRKV